ncbi:hypothetical protein CDD83_11236 [Cordyceps sp. RAO-2017]|nr:hypothetical protein CDD83_11236 [Cordyceps sp. RAO-2017]
MSKTSDRKPVADQAEADAWFPSPYSLTQYTAPKTDFDGADYPNAYKGGKWKVLVIGTQERYLKMEDGSFFSTGNHPVEMLLPMLHLDAAGFELDIATLSGDPVKLEMWAFPGEDKAVRAIFDKYRDRLRSPRRLADVWGAGGFGPDTPYLGVFVPGGHGVLNDVPFSAAVGDVLRWAHAHQRFTITLCHGPACLLAADVGKPAGAGYIYDGYELVVFPDALDREANVDIGYLPARMTWYVGEALAKLGVKALNAGITGQNAVFTQIGADDFMSVLRTNTLSVFLAAKHAAPAMMKTSGDKPAGGGSIVGTASVAGLRSNAGSTPYSASKAAVVSLAQTLAYQLAGSGVRVNAVCPGLIETGMTAPVYSAARARGTEGRIGQLNPMRRGGHADEIARVVLFLASDESSYVNGQAWAVDGGLSAGHPVIPSKLA